MSLLTTENTEATEMVWVLAQDQLPDSDIDVIVCTEDGHVEGGFHDGDAWRWTNAHLIKCGVTHWMPFPNSPKEGER